MWIDQTGAVHTVAPDNFSTYLSPHIVEAIRKFAKEDVKALDQMLGNEHEAWWKELEANTDTTEGVPDTLPPCPPLSPSMLTSLEAFAQAIRSTPLLSRLDLIQACTGFLDEMTEGTLPN